MKARQYIFDRAKEKYGAHFLTAVLYCMYEVSMAGKKKNEKESLATFRRITRYDQMIASGTYPSGKNFIDEFETSEATVHRDLDALRYDFARTNI